MAGSVYIVGAGGHAVVVADAARLVGVAVIAFLDDDPARAGEAIAGAPVMPRDAVDVAGAAFHVAIGANGARSRIQAELTAAGGAPLAIAHPRAIVADGVLIGLGAFVAAGAVAAPRAVIGAGAVVNHNAVVDHDCDVGAFAHIAPGAVLGGGVAIGERTLVGAGAVVAPGCVVGADCAVGAGAVATRDIDEGTTVVGVPARPRRGGV